MKKIFLVRHGESEWNILKRIQGQQDIPLTNKGRLQAQEIGNRLLDEKIDIIYSSDLIRAYDTATIIGGELKIKVKPMHCLREINFGSWEGVCYDKIHLINSEELALWKSAPEKLNVKGVETLKELQSRIMPLVNKIINNETPDNILIVSHSATLKVMILSLLNMSLKGFKNLTLDNVSLSTIEFRDYNRVLKMINDTNHLRRII